MGHELSYQDTIDYLYALQKHGVKLGLANTVALMAALGNPHRAFPSIHVAGTNGKGSTCAFLASMLQNAGYRTGLYTSPHLVSFTERIRVNGVPIPEAQVVELARKVRAACHAGKDGQEQLNPTFFEVTTAMAFSYFAEQAVDLAVIEVGMGGRLDSTNVVNPLVSVITTIDLEHTEFLGDTIELIAGEKAGIIKPQTPVVSGAVQPEAVEVIRSEAEARGARLYLLSRDFGACSLRGGALHRFDYHGIGRTFEGLVIGLAGRHQVDNACLALAALECVSQRGVIVDDTALRRGLAEARWEGRLELISRKPDLFLDGAHNPASARKLAAEMQVLKPGYNRLILVIGILGDKDVRGMLAELLPVADEVFVTRPEYSRAMDLEALAAEVRKMHGSVRHAPSVSRAIEEARKTAEPDDLILVTGSLYVVGDAKASFACGGRGHDAFSGLKG
jgi:dihydrofolate synthase/folylpolyglutamate synthase